ncbi:hypothetical protein C900_05088 [Fulvivirga imtechensis AK7]|uniref:DUF4374 domain-containing protein n=1 Tax=Fulvivirga imtechensis AK7 TaxID=1237149 RepID=L8JMF3_9BACT|nr:DUF4374 domain-containing protein [Fulvivirga imtechensis]ELR69398.1 hypothetical protein C900_05088 [Fulvivirga imtechensis AK7]
MKIQFLNLWYCRAALFFLSALACVACSDDDGPAATPETEVNYAVSTVSGAWPDLTTYIQGLENLDLSSVDNSNAIELTGSASTVAYGKSLFATPFGAPANLVKYVFNNEGLPEEEERIVVPGANTFSTLHFESETVAYGTVSGGISKLIIFNPTTMRIEDEIPLSAVIDKVPEATRTYYLDMLERDNKLFMGVHYENNFVPVNDSAYVAVIDLATHQVEKVIADGRTGMVFGGQSPNSGMVKTSNGDIYVQALGTTNAGGSSPSGVLRINNGETTFDQDYFFNLEDATGNICFGIYHTSAGQSFTARVEDESDFWEYATGQPQFKYYKINLDGETSEGAVQGLPVTYGSRRMIIHEESAQSLLFSIATNDENAVYRYDLSSDNATKLFTSSGGYITGLEKLD